MNAATATLDQAALPGPDALYTPGGARVEPPFTWSIQGFADMFDTTPRAVRFYESKGLLSPARSGSGRVFGAVEFLRLERIQRAKRLGFSLDDIREVFEVIDGEVSDRGELLRRRADFQAVLDGLGRHRRDIDVVADDMRSLCDQIDTHLADAPTQDPDAQDPGTTVFQFAQAYADRLSRSLSN